MSWLFNFYNSYTVGDKMERIRIRTMLNNIRQNQGCYSSRRTIDSEVHGPSIGYFMKNDESSSIFEDAKIAHNFTIEPLQYLQVDVSSSFPQQNWGRFHKNSLSTHKEAPRVRSRISNRSFNLSIQPKNKESLENLEQLNIGKKRILNRSSKLTNKNIIIDQDEKPEMKKKDCCLENQNQMYLRCQTSEKKRQVFTSLRNTRISKIRKSQKNETTPTFQIQQKNSKKQSKKQQESKPKILKMLGIIRKSSDICGWESEPSGFSSAMPSIF